MIVASSTTVLANLAYVIGAVVVAVVIGVVVWLRHRQPKSVDATISSFRKGLSALAPEDGVGPTRPSQSRRIRSAPVGLDHVRVDPHGPGDTHGPSRPAPARHDDDSGGAETG